MHQLGVSMILTNSENELFVAKRSKDKDFGAGLWEFPSGRMEEGETLRETLEREAFEELGIKIERSELFDAYTFDRNSISLALLSYLCTYTGKITLSDEHEIGRWVTPEEAILLFNFEKQRESVKLLTKLMKKST